MRNTIFIVSVFLFTAAFGQNHWEIINRSNMVGCYLEFVGDLVGWTCTYTEPYDLYKTTDGGYTWTGRNIGLHGPCIKFYNEHRGFYADGHHVAVTVDGGDTWIIRTLSDNIGVEAVVYLDSMRMIGTSNMIWNEDSTRRQITRSTDGGLTWSVLASEICRCAFDRPVISPSGTILITGGRTNEVWRSTNVGDNWQIVPTDISTLFSVISNADTGVFFRTVFGASAGPPQIVRSADDGSTWQTVWAGDSTLPRPFWLMDIQFPDPLHGWAAGDDGLMIQTSDGGNTWTSYYLPESTFGIISMSFLDSTTGWAVDPGVGSPTLVYRWSLTNDFDGRWRSTNAATPQIVAVYPNPFNSSTKISFTILQTAQVSLSVYNLLGQEVATLVHGSMPAGTHTISFDGSALASGVYIYSLEANGFSAQKKMAMVK